MANLSNVTYTANGVTTVFVVPFGYIEEADIEVKVDGVVVTGYAFNGSGDVDFTIAPANGLEVYISRDSDVTQRITSYSDGSSLTEGDLNDNGDQSIYLHQETRDLIDTINADNSSVVSRVEALETDTHTHANKAILDATTASYTTASESKLAAIEASATADQTGAEIKAAYEAEADTNAYNDAAVAKLAGIEASADVTDATNVNAAGAVMESDTTTASMAFVIDEDTMVSNSATKVPTQQSVKAYADTKAGGSEVTDHAALASSHGVSGDIVGTSSVQTLTNKTFNDAITLQEIVTPSTPSSGYKKIYPKSDGKLYTLSDLGVETEVGSGGSGGGLDVFYQENFEDLITSSDFTSGNNATYDNGGTIDGTLSDDVTTQIAGVTSLKYTMGSTSTNDFIKSPAIALDAKQKGQTIGMEFYYTYDGDNDDIKIVIYDDTNSQVLTTSIDFLKASSTPQRFSVQVPTNSDTANLHWGFQVVTGNSGKILVVDDIQMSTNPYVSKDFEIVNRIALEGNDGRAITGSTENIPFIGSDNGWTSGVDGSTDNYYTVQFNDSVIKLYAGVSASAVGLNSVYLYLDTGSGFAVYKRIGEYLSNDQHFANYLSGKGEFNVGDKISFRVVNGLTLINTSSHTLNIEESQSTNHIIAYNSRNAENSMVRLHTSNGFGSTNTKIRRFTTEVTNTGNAITYADSATLGASFTINDDGIYNITYVDGSSVDGFIGISKNSTQLTTDVDTITTADRLSMAGTLSAVGLGSCSVSGISLQKGDVIRPHSRGSVGGYSAAAVTFIISKIGVGDLLGVPVPRTCYIKDVKASGTDGGTFTSGAWRTRDLNTLTGDTEFVSLDSNQFTLEAGKYNLILESPAYKVNSHKIKLYDVTNAADVNELPATSSYANGTGNVNNVSRITGVLEITSPTTYEIQHRCGTTVSLSGFGLATALADEVYTDCAITKIS